MNYGIELEFFVAKKDGTKVPAYLATQNLDGNPAIGEIRTTVHPNIVDCVFELEKLLFLEREKIDKNGYVLNLLPSITVDDTFLKDCRSSADFVNRKELEVLTELSIYGKGTGKLLPRNVYKASLQVNISCNTHFDYPTYSKVQVEDKVKYDSGYGRKHYSEAFDYYSVIRKLDDAFSKEIADAKRVKGVYAIKNGTLGKRIEYRSLPNSIYLLSLITALK